MYGRAEPLYERALAIREAALGKNHPDVADALNNLASLYLDQGLYGRAEPLYQRALAIREAALGKNHPDVASSLNNLAILYMEQGLYGRAEPLYQRALAIREAALGKNHPDVADSLNNLAILYVDQGLYGRAEPLHERALAIREAALGKHHPDVADSLDNLASLYVDQGLYGRAEPLYERALAIREAALGKNHPARRRVAQQPRQPLPGAGDVRPGRAALRARARHSGSGPRQEPSRPSPNRSTTSPCSGWPSIASARPFRCSPAPSPCPSSACARRRSTSPRRAWPASSSFCAPTRSASTRCCAPIQTTPASRRLALSAALLLKGRSVEETADISRAVYRSLGAEDRDTFERLRGLRTQLAKLSLQGPGSLPPAAYQQHLQELAEQGDALEADLARRSAPLRALAALPSPAEIVDRVAAALPKDGALVEFITYVDRPLVPKPGTPEARLRTAALPGAGALS